MSAAENMEQWAARFEGRITDPIEGVWQFPSDGATIAICATSKTTFEITTIDSPNLTVEAGEKIGTVAMTPEVGKYEATINNSVARAGNKKIKSKTCVMTLTADDRLRIEPYEKGVRISLWRWIPYIFRVGVKQYDTRPTGLDGAIRLYPQSEAQYKPCL